jgi:hypothetical protein
VARVFSGARARLFFGDTLMGFCTGISGSVNTQLVRIDVLGNIDSEEIERVGRTVSFTADFVRLLGKSLQEHGIFPRGDTAYAINFPPLTAVVYDHVGDSVVYRIEGVVGENVSWRVDRSGVMTENATFQAIKLVDEAGT